MNVNTEIRVSRLNYEWTHLVKYIKSIDMKMWDSTYEIIQDKLGKLLVDNEVSIGSEYSIFDDCIRQVPDLFGELMHSYETIIKNYRTVLGLGVILPMEEISTLLQKYNVGLVEIDQFFRQINIDISNEGYMDTSGIYVDGTKYYGFRPTEHNLSLLNVMKIDVPVLNSDQFMADVKEYINVIVMYKVMPLIESDELLQPSNLVHPS